MTLKITIDSNLTEVGAGSLRPGCVYQTKSGLLALGVAETFQYDGEHQYTKVSGIWLNGSIEFEPVDPRDTAELYEVKGVLTVEAR